MKNYTITVNGNVYDVIHMDVPSDLVVHDLPA